MSAAFANAIHPGHGGDVPWWRQAVIYQIYPRSFADSNSDGVGDLPGITAHLDHLVQLGVDAVWVSPFYPSPQADAGYDVADYCDVDPMFGTLADFDLLIRTAHESGLRVLVDLVPNHTSAQHPWFQAALTAAPDSPARARYLFRDGRADGSRPPNNWRSVMGGPAWTRVTGTDGQPEQWYLHLFDSSQPDLDWTDPEVRTYFEQVLHFWLQRGVDGFRVDVAHAMVKADGLPDWEALPPSADNAAGPLPGGAAPMFDQEGVHEIIRSWRRILDSYPGDRCMVAEAWVEPMPRLARYVRSDEMHQTFNFPFLEAGWSAPRLREAIIASYLAYDEVGAPATWVFSNHDVLRPASRFGLTDPSSRPAGIGRNDEQPDAALGLRRARAAAALMLALPGAAYLYQGEELGLPDHTTLDDALRQDPAYHRSAGKEAGRDGCRIPLPWLGDGPSMGFSSSAQTWLPQPECYRDLAVDRQEIDPQSTLFLYRHALKLRREHGLGTSTFRWPDPTELIHEHAASASEAADPDGRTQIRWDPKQVLAFWSAQVLVVTNFGDDLVLLPTNMQAVLFSQHLSEVDAGAVAAARNAEQVGAESLFLPADTTVWLVQRC